MSEVYEVGRYYQVPCVRSFPFYATNRSYWIPVTGPLHDDVDLGVPDPHWHVDWRFVSDVLIREYWGNQPGDESAFGAEWPSFMMGRLIGLPPKGAPERAPVIRKRRCVREMPVFPAVPKFRAKLETLCAGMRLKPGCMVCPHRGVPLTGPVNSDGRTVCPGHGAMWDLRTGEIVSRVPGARDATVTTGRKAASPGSKAEMLSGTTDGFAGISDNRDRRTAPMPAETTDTNVMTEADLSRLARQSGLSASLEQAIHAACVLGLDEEAGARQLGISPNAYRVRLCRAGHALRREQYVFETATDLDMLAAASALLESSPEMPEAAAEELSDFARDLLDAMRGPTPCNPPAPVFTEDCREQVREAVIRSKIVSPEDVRDRYRDGWRKETIQCPRENRERRSRRLTPSQVVFG